MSSPHGQAENLMSEGNPKLGVLPISCAPGWLDTLFALGDRTWTVGRNKHHRVSDRHLRPKSLPDYGPRAAHVRQFRIFLRLMP